jgi:hypothetical protein
MRSVSNIRLEQEALKFQLLAPENVNDPPFSARLNYVKNNAAELKCKLINNLEYWVALHGILGSRVAIQNVNITSNTCNYRI